jgi:hypothetical protein
MARGVLERVGLADVFGGRDDGPPPPSPQAALGEVFKMPPRPETEDQAREREAAEEAHRQANPRSQPCQCGCMRWQSDRAANGDLIWICSGCHRRFLPRDPSQAIVRPAPPAPPPPTLPSPAEARQALVAAVEAVAEAVGRHDSLSKAAESARAAVAQAEQVAEVAEQALAAARVQAREDAARALAAGRTLGPLDLSKVRGEVEKASDALLAAKGAREAIEGQQEAARRALVTAQAKGDEAALRVLAAELGVPLVARTQALVAELTAAMARLGWLSGRRAFWSPEAQALLALQGLAVRDWPLTTKIAAESDSALDRALPALVADPTVTVPAP